MLKEFVGEKTAEEMTALVMSSPVPAVLVDKNVAVMTANPSALRFFDQKSEDVFRHPLGELLRCVNRHENIRGCGHGRLCKHCIVRTSGYEVVATRQPANGRETDIVLEMMPDCHHQLFRVRFNMTPVMLGGVPYVLFQILDSTSLKLESEHRLRQIEWLETAYSRMNFFRLPIDLSAVEQKALNPALPAHGLAYTGLGASVLEGVAMESLDAGGICFVLSEADGELAFSLFDRGWLHFYLAIIRRRLATPNRRVPVEEVDVWKVFRRVLRAAASRVRRNGTPLDTQLTEGVRLFVHPVWVRSSFGGAVMFAYADQTATDADVESIAVRFGYPYARLKEEASASSCVVRSVEGIAHAKVQLGISALLLGTLLEARFAEEERDKMELQLQQAQKMEAIGRLAGGVAHDFNNVLQAVIGNAELLRDGLPKGGEFAGYVDEILDVSRRATSLSRQLLTFARQQPGRAEIFELGHAVTDSLKMLRHLAGTGVDIEWTPCSTPGYVRLDPVQLDQVLVNLVVNARDALGRKPDGHIRISARTVEGTALASVPGLGRQAHVALRVSDNGCGMTKQVVQRIFEPFFTTKAKGSGTGLGLSNVYGVVKQAGGTITVDSEPGVGTSFDIYFPRQEAPAGATAGDVARPAVDEEQTPFVKGSRETVLLVDDEPSLLRAGYHQLVAAGYTVLAAASGRAAFDIARNYEGPIDLLLTDVVMPGMSGDELFARVAQLRPRIRCVYTSGFSENLRALPDVSTAAGTVCLQKPFTADALECAIRQVLRG